MENNQNSMADAEKVIIEKIREQFDEVNFMGTAEIIALALKVFDTLLEKFPDYEERKKKKYFELKMEYLEELKSERRDMNKLMNLRDELFTTVSVFVDELGGKK